MQAKPKQIIGRTESIDFPELGVTGLSAKVDTGAYSNTLHCNQLSIKEGKLCFTVLDEKEHCFEAFSQKRIKNSSGETEKRFIIRTKIRIAGRTIKSIISLTNRKNMRYPALIGRRLLKNKFVVDVSLKR